MLKSRLFSLSVYKLLGLLAGAYFVYYLLLEDKILPFSIRSVLTRVQPLVSHFPVLEVGFLPVYMGCMIFGMTILGLYAGSLLERFINRFKRSN